MYTITHINGLPIIEIDNFLSSKVIDEILTPRKLSFEQAISHYPNYYRNNDRLVEDNTKLSTILFKKLTTFPVVAKVTNAKIIGINERIRFCRYQKDQLFSKHQDGVFYPNATQESKFTFLLYLNDHPCFEGGETEFYTAKDNENSIKTIAPKKGKLIIFDHRIWHKGAKVKRGTKFILRSDIIVERHHKSLHHDGYIWNLLKLNSKQFLSGGRDKKIKLWNANLEHQKTIKIHDKSVIKMVNLDREIFVSCSRDFTIKKWNLSGEILSFVTLNEMILNLQILKNKQIIATGTSGKIFLLSSNLDIIKIMNVHANWIWGLAIMNQEEIISCCEDGRVLLTNLISEKTMCIYTANQSLFCISKEKKDTVCIGTKDGTLIRLCIKTKQTDCIKVHSDIIRSIIYDKGSIITCAEDNTVKLIDKRFNKVIEIFAKDNFMQDIITLNECVYIAGFDGMIYKIKTPKLIHNQFIPDTMNIG